MNRQLSGRIAALCFALLIVVACVASVNANEKVTLCHAAGQEGTTHYITLEVGWNAAYGPAGHFYENGTPRAGHEQDYLGACEPSESPSASPSPSLSPSPTPSTTSTPTPSSTPQPSASPTPPITPSPSTSPTPIPTSSPTPAPTATAVPRVTLPPTDTE